MSTIDSQPFSRFFVLNIITLKLRTDGCQLLMSDIIRHHKTQEGNGAPGTADQIKRLRLFITSSYFLNLFFCFLASLQEDVPVRPFVSSVQPVTSIIYM